MRSLILAGLLGGFALAGGSDLPPAPALRTAPARAAYRQVQALLAQRKLGEARKAAALAVQATAAHLPPCVNPGPAQGPTFSVLFRPGEALRLLTRVGGGRVNLYELRPDGVYRLWQAQKSNPGAMDSALSRMLGVLPGAAQCGTPPTLAGPLEVFSFNPFTGSMFAERWQPDGQTERLKVVDLDQDMGGGRMVYLGLPGAPPLVLPGK